jgi:hypothetical protein
MHLTQQAGDACDLNHFRSAYNMKPRTSLKNLRDLIDHSLKLICIEVLWEVNFHREMLYFHFSLLECNNHIRVDKSAREGKDLSTARIMQKLDPGFLEWCANG